jgi:hypothetical protein
MNITADTLPPELLRDRPALDLHRTMRPAEARLESLRNVFAITAGNRVAEALAADPRVDQVSLRLRFDRTLDPVARRTVARTVTVAQAYRLKGVDPDIFVASLRAALGGPSGNAGPSELVSLKEECDV